MKKKIWTVLFVLVLCLCVTVPAFAEGAVGFAGDKEDRVVDGADLLSDIEETELREKLEEIRVRQKMDIVIVTAKTLNGATPTAYADDFYDYNGYGYGNNRDGLLLLISMENRKWYISTTGYGITAFTDAGIQYIGNKLKEPLSDEDYAAAFNTFAELCDDFITKARNRVVDGADLLSDIEETELREKLEEIRVRQKMDIVIVTAKTLNGATPTAYADDFYDYNGYGYGNNRDGLLLLISMENRKWYISTTGYGITAFTDAGIQYIGNKLKEPLSDEDYAAAFNTFAELCDDFITKARTGTPYDSSNMPKEPMKRGWILVAIIVGFILSFITVGNMKGKLKTVRFQPAANSYMKAGSMNITESRDMFLYNTVTRTAKPKANDSDSEGSSTHTSSSGSTHGGGGGSF